MSHPVLGVTSKDQPRVAKMLENVYHSSMRPPISLVLILTTGLLGCSQSNPAGAGGAGGSNVDGSTDSAAGSDGASDAQADASSGPPVLGQVNFTIAAPQCSADNACFASPL